jgi:predicted dehydrogenase
MEILIIGLGSIGIKHANAIRQIAPSTKIFALRSGKKKISFGGINNINSIDELENKPNFAIIANPTNLHEYYIRELAIRDIPMMIEKPALHAFDNAAALLGLIKRNGSFTYVACNLRFHPCILFLKSYLAANYSKVNEVSVYCGSYLPDWRPNVNFKEVYSSNLNMGGGVHLDLIHELDYTTWLFGVPIQSSGFQSSVSTLQIDAPDYAHYLLNYAHFNVSITLNYFRREPKRRIEIVFDDLTLNVDLINNKVINGRGELMFEEVNFSFLDTYCLQMKYFIDKLSEHEPTMNTFEDSLNVLKIALSNEQISK